MATKCGRQINPHVNEGYTVDVLRKYVEDSLKNTGLECLDLIQLHCPPTEVYYRPEIFELFDRLKDEGKIKNLGVSIEKIEEGLKAIEYPNVKTVQIIFNMFRQRPSELFFEQVQKKDVGVIVRVPLASGLLTGKFSSDSTFDEEDHRNFNRDGAAFDKGETFSGVPFTFEMLKKLKFENIHLPTINYLTQAGGKLRNSLLEYFSKVSTQKNIDFIVMYGQTEASPRMSYLPSEMLQSKIGSIGIPIPNGKFYLVDNEHQIVNEPNIEGELIYEGENVCMGYARDCYDLDKNDFNKGILKTGDMAKVDSDGYYYITGRKKRFLKIFGNRVSLDQIEQKINEAGYDCACVGTDDYMKIYTTEKSYVQKIQDYIGKYFEINKSGFSIICINTIPRNHSGKILYSELVKN